MRLLLDTHIFILWNGRAELISSTLREAIGDGANDVFVSAASVWEIGVKRAIGKLDFSRSIAEAVRGHRFQLLAITGEHAEHAAGLPRHHTDPFDRMLVAQAVMERMLIATRDPKIGSYGVPVLGLA